MSKPRLLAPLAVLAAAAFLLAACGDDDDDSSQDQDDITAAIEESATTNAPENCTTLQTQAFTEQTEFTSGEEAVTACERNVGDDVAAESVEVENVEVDGDSATAEATFTGGSLGGQSLAISLVKEGDQWKLDSLDEFTSFDRAAFAEGVAAGAAEGDTPQEVVDCVEQQVNDTADEELQTIYLSGDPEQLFGLFGPCFQGG